MAEKHEGRSPDGKVSYAFFESIENAYKKFIEPKDTYITMFEIITAVVIFLRDVAAQNGISNKELRMWILKIFDNLD